MIVIKTSETIIYTAYYKDRVIKEIRGVFSYEEARQILHDMHPEAEICGWKARMNPYNILNAV